LTVAVETAVLFLLLRTVYRTKVPRPGNVMVFAAGILASFATLPYVWFLVPYFAGSRITCVAFSEVFATAAEIPILCAILRIPPTRASVLSLACNLSSFGVGLLVNALK
jgi:hypothetical protein